MHTTRYDFSGGGKLDESEFLEACRYLRLPVDTQKVREMITEVDYDGDGVLDYDE